MTSVGDGTVLYFDNGSYSNLYIWLNVTDMSHVWIVHKDIQKNVKTAEIWVTLVKCCV